MPFAEALTRQQAAIFARFGEDADWPGIAAPVRVILRENDEEARLGTSVLLARARTLRVRASDVVQPVAGTVVHLAAGDLVLCGDAELDRKRVWHCSVATA